MAYSESELSNLMISSPRAVQVPDHQKQLAITHAPSPDLRA